MGFRFVNPSYREIGLRAVGLAIAGMAAVIGAADLACATSDRSGSIEAVEARAAGEPVMAIVSLRSQRITVYDTKGLILRAPVSSGQAGRETPAGVFSVIQKNAEHYSNLYDDAYMPHMQRITWSGIALHGGALPGYPASHGCVRLPFDFAARLFDLTRMGMRVIVAPGDVAPVEIIHPALFQAKPGAMARAAALAAEASAATAKADQARLVAVTAYREAVRASQKLRVAENLQLRVGEQLAVAETALASALSAEAREQAEDAKAKAVAKLAELRAQWSAEMAEVRPKLEAVGPAREAALAAEAARVAAAAAARQAAGELEPISVFISRQTQRLYIRRAFAPVLESPVTILDPDRPIGTHVFTALERTSHDTDLRWSVVSLQGRHAAGGTGSPPGRARADRGRAIAPVPSDHAGGKAALDRIAIPQEILDRIADMLSPRASLIISDEALSQETGKETEFVVVLSGEPQGSLKMRRPVRRTEFP